MSCKVETDMYPAQGDEVVLVLHQKQLLFILRVTVIWTATLFRHDHMCHRERVPILQQAHTHTLHLDVLMHCISKTYPKIYA